MLGRGEGEEKGAVIVYVLGASGVLAAALVLTAPEPVLAPRAEKRVALAAAAPAPTTEGNPAAASW